MNYSHSDLPICWDNGIVTVRCLHLSYFKPDVFTRLSLSAEQDIKSRHVRCKPSVWFARAAPWRVCAFSLRVYLFESLCPVIN